MAARLTAVEVVVPLAPVGFMVCVRVEPGSRLQIMKGELTPLSNRGVATVWM